MDDGEYIIGRIVDWLGKRFGRGRAAGFVILAILVGVLVVVVANAFN